MSEEFRALEMQEPLQPLHDPAADPAPETFKGDNEGLRDAAQELSERRAAEAPTISRFYHNEGERLPANVTIDAKRGARDLADLRRQEADIVEQQAAEQFRLEVDADRMNHATGEQPSPEVQEALAPQPEATETAANGVDPEVARALENPRVRDAIAQQVQVADALRHHYAEALANVAHAQDAQFIAAFPEMAGTTPQTFQTTLQAINQRNPQRAAEIVAHVQRAQAHLQTVQAHRFAEAQRQTQATQDWMRQQDDAFEQSIKDEPPEVVKRVRSEIGKIATEHYGVSEAELAHLWNTQPLMRAAAFQKVFYDAAKYRLTQQAVKPAPKHLPPVMRPGMRDSNWPTYGESRLTQATETFKEAPTLRNAAARLSALRAYRAANGR